MKRACPKTVPCEVLQAGHVHERQPCAVGVTIRLDPEQAVRLATTGVVKPLNKLEDSK